MWTTGPNLFNVFHCPSVPFSFSCQLFLPLTFLLPGSNLLFWLVSQYSFFNCNAFLGTLVISIPLTRSTVVISPLTQLTNFGYQLVLYKYFTLNPSILVFCPIPPQQCHIDCLQLALLSCTAISCKYSGSPLQQQFVKAWNIVIIVNICYSHNLIFQE